MTPLTRPRIYRSKMLGGVSYEFDGLFEISGRKIRIQVAVREATDASSTLISRYDTATDKFAVIVYHPGSVIVPWPGPDATAEDVLFGEDVERAIDEVKALYG